MLGFKGDARGLPASGFESERPNIPGGAKLGRRGLREVPAVIDLPLVVCVRERGPDQRDHGVLVREEPHDAGAAFDLFVQPLEQVRGPDLPPVLLGKNHERENLVLRGLHQGSHLRQPGPELGYDIIPRSGHRGLIRLGKDRAEDRGGHLGLGLSHVGEDVPDEVDPATLVPGS